MNLCTGAEYTLLRGLALTCLDTARIPGNVASVPVVKLNPAFEPTRVRRLRPVTGIPRQYTYGTQVHLRTSTEQSSGPLRIQAKSASWLLQCASCVDPLIRSRQSWFGQLGRLWDSPMLARLTSRLLSTRSRRLITYSTTTSLLALTVLSSPTLNPWNSRHLHSTSTTMGSNGSSTAETGSAQYPLQISEDEWRIKLSKEQFRVSARGMRSSSSVNSHTARSWLTSST